MCSCLLFWLCFSLYPTVFFLLPFLDFCLLSTILQSIKCRKIWRWNWSVFENENKIYSFVYSLHLLLDTFVHLFHYINILFTLFFLYAITLLFLSSSLTWLILFFFLHFSPILLLSIFLSLQCFFFLSFHIICFLPFSHHTFLFANLQNFLFKSFLFLFYFKSFPFYLSVFHPKFLCLPFYQRFFLVFISYLSRLSSVFFEWVFCSFGQNLSLSLFPPKSSFLPKSFFFFPFLSWICFLPANFYFLSCVCQFHYLFVLHFTHKLFLLNHSVIFHFLLCFNLCLFIPILFLTLPIIYFS